MLVEGDHYRTIWADANRGCITIIDQTRLPHRFETVTLSSLDQAADAISNMQVRGAPLIGATGAYGLWLGLLEDSSDAALKQAAQQLISTRPTAVNLAWAIQRMVRTVSHLENDLRADAALSEADRICEEDVEHCRQIGLHGVHLISAIHRDNPGRPVNILTHCNAGWLATIDWGTATAPIYHAQLGDIPVHVWVDETRPRNQGAALTCFELGQQGVPHTLITDNAGGHLMQQGEVDMVITGTDRTASNGDVANKIGTYLKALAARDNDIPFYVALPSSTIDWDAESGSAIPIENRGSEEVTQVEGLCPNGEPTRVTISPENSGALNPAFDVTSAELVTALITERGVTEASKAGLLDLFPERRHE